VEIVVGVASMLRLCSRVGAAACGRPLLGGVLARGISAPAIVRATPTLVPALSNFQTSHNRANERYDHRMALWAWPLVSLCSSRIRMLRSARRVRAEKAPQQGASTCASEEDEGRACPHTCPHTMHHNLKGSMEDGSLEHSFIATANTE